MPQISRRAFLKTAGIATAAATLRPNSWAQVAGANSDVRLGLVGMNNRGKDVIKELASVAGQRITALCDVDSVVLEGVANTFKDKGQKVQTFADYRDLLAKG
ncbi:MAG TPA: twin-arginine translocation signal domain-containing protein, partial [Opitutales bacterium]|nr:twin-arginine translocation signal domain-containing protein [Opitutales bacterium]